MAETGAEFLWVFPIQSLLSINVHTPLILGGQIQQRVIRSARPLKNRFTERGQVINFTNVRGNWAMCNCVWYAGCAKPFEDGEILVQQRRLMYNLHVKTNTTSMTPVSHN